MEIEFTDCEDCAMGIHGIPKQGRPNVCACCLEVVGAEQLLPPPKNPW